MRRLCDQKREKKKSEDRTDERTSGDDHTCSIEDKAPGQLLGRRRNKHRQSPATIVLTPAILAVVVMLANFLLDEIQSKSNIFRYDSVELISIKPTLLQI